MIFSDPKTARKINRLRVLNAIQQNGSISRAALSRELLINKVSISEIVASLLKEGLIEEFGKMVGALGRQPIMLQVRKQAGYVIALDIGLKNSTFGIGNLNGELVRFERSPTPFFEDADELIGFAEKAITKLLGKITNPEALLGCSISIHAGVDSESGILLYSEDWNLSKIPLADQLSKTTGIPVTVDSNVRSMLLAERWFGEVDPSASVLYINWGQKIGAAQISGNTILSLNSEFGHTPVGGSLECFCGRTGCLETAAGGWSLQKRGNAILGTPDMTVKRLYQESVTNPELKQLFEDAARHMGSALALAANIIRPDIVIIGGGLAETQDNLFRIMNESFSLQAAPRTRSSALVVRSALGDRAGILGAVVLGLNTFLYRRTQIDLLGDIDNSFFQGLH